jgi:hypothetical protein
MGSPASRRFAPQLPQRESFSGSAPVSPIQKRAGAGVAPLLSRRLRKNVLGSPGGLAKRLSMFARSNVAPSPLSQGPVVPLSARLGSSVRVARSAFHTKLPPISLPQRALTASAPPSDQAPVKGPIATTRFAGPASPVSFGPASLVPPLLELDEGGGGSPTQAEMARRLTVTSTNNRMLGAYHAHFAS